MLYTDDVGLDWVLGSIADTTRKIIISATAPPATGTKAFVGSESTSKPRSGGSTIEGFGGAIGSPRSMMILAPQYSQSTITERSETFSMIAPH